MPQLTMKAVKRQRPVIRGEKQIPLLEPGEYYREEYTRDDEPCVMFHCRCPDGNYFACGNKNSHVRATERKGVLHLDGVIEWSARGNLAVENDWTIRNGVWVKEPVKGRRDE